MQPTSRPRRRWLQFSIRSLLLLTFAVAGVFAFWVRPSLSQREAIASLRGHYTDITYDAPRDERTGRFTPRFVPEWLVKKLGIDFFASVAGLEVYDATDETLLKLQAFPRLTTLVLHGTDFTSDDGLAPVGQLRQLQVLSLAHSKTSDRRLQHLSGLNNLESLELSDTRVTDAGLQALHGLMHLRTLQLSYTSVTDQGVATLRQSLPQCVVARDGL